MIDGKLENPIGEAKLPDLNGLLSMIGRSSKTEEKSHACAGFRRIF
jgi:hypothetical protein